MGNIKKNKVNFMLRKSQKKLLTFDNTKLLEGPGSYVQHLLGLETQL